MEKELNINTEIYDILDKQELLEISNLEIDDAMKEVAMNLLNSVKILEVFQIHEFTPVLLNMVKAMTEAKQESEKIDNKPIENESVKRSEEIDSIIDQIEAIDLDI